MTRLGESICLLCGETSKKIVFFDPKLSASITVTRDLAGRYGLRAQGRDQEVSGVWLRKKLTIDRDSGQITKIEGELQFKDGETRHPFILRSRNRICPHCLAEKKIAQLPPYAGMAPAFLIGVSGLPGTGKSVLLRSLFTGKSIHALHQALGGCRLETGLSDESSVPDATQLVENDPLRLLKTVRVVNARGKLTALLYLKDSPGELFDPDQTGTEEWERHFAPFAKADAILYVMDHRNVQGIAQGETPAGSVPPQKPSFDPDPFLQELPRDLPVAVVLTKVDQLADHLPLRSQDDVRILLNYASPVFLNTAPQIEAIAQQMALNRRLILDLVPYLSVSPLSHSRMVGYFTLSSGVDRADGSFDYTKGYNQAAPFLFLLNALGLASVRGEVREP